MLDRVVIFDFLLYGYLNILYKLALLVVDIITLIWNVLDLTEPLLNAYVL